MRKLLIFVFLTFAALGALGATASAAGASPEGDEHEFLQRLNQVRHEHGKAPVVLDPGLSGDARTWSAVMRSKNLLHHTDSTRMVNEIAAVVPSWQRIGENVGVGYSVGSLHDAFWNSPGHRANMVGDFNRVGLGVVHEGNKIWVTFRYVKGPAISGTTGLNTSKSGFPDVFDSAYYATAVGWLSSTGVTTGVGSTGLFQPDSPVTRAQMATFLWRLAGQPRASAPAFSDVPSGAYYAPAVTWMRDVGLTTGVGGTNRFDPNSVVTREQMAAFLHRFAGVTATSGRHGFWDVAPTSFADKAVTWLATFGITTGITPERFDPRGAVTRGQMATFLYRLNGTRSALSATAQRIAI